MSSDQPIYVITVLEDSRNTSYGFSYHGDIRVWGFYFDKPSAIKALHENWTDIHEDCYEFATIEEYQEGVVAKIKSIQWFQWDERNDGYFEIEKPEWESEYYGFAMG